MKLFSKFEIIDSYPGLWIEEFKTVVIADLHLGLESLMASEGIYFPKFQLKEIKEDLRKILNDYSPERIIINGDTKHDFSGSNWKEKEEVKDLLNFLSLKVNEVNLIKGNHDNYLIYNVKDFNNVNLKEKIDLGNICFIHGHQKQIGADSDFIILAHEHPALILKDELGIKEKVRCFLYGTIDSKKVIIMPAFSKLASGSQVNEIPRQELLSPWLRRKGIDKLRPVAVSEDDLLKFPKIKEL